MLIISWAIGLLAFLAAVCSIRWLCAHLVRSMRQHWRNAPSGGSAFNPLLEFVQPRARHVVEVGEQRLNLKGEGSPPDPASDAQPTMQGKVGRG